MSQGGGPTCRAVQSQEDPCILWPQAGKARMCTQTFPVDGFSCPSAHACAVVRDAPPRHLLLCRMEQNECECPCECPLEVNECTGNLTNAENR